MATGIGSTWLDEDDRALGYATSWRDTGMLKFFRYSFHLHGKEVVSGVVLSTAHLHVRDFFETAMIRKGVPSSAFSLKIEEIPVPDSPNNNSKVWVLCDETLTLLNNIAQYLG